MLIDSLDTAQNQQSPGEIKRIFSRCKITTSFIPNIIPAPQNDREKKSLSLS